MATATPPNPSSSFPNPPVSASAPAPSTSSGPSSLPISALISSPIQTTTQLQPSSSSSSSTSASPSSLLWAHQLRTEHVALSNRMDRLNALFTKATNAIANLDSNVGQLADGMQVLEQQREMDKRDYDARIQELVEGVQAKVENSTRFEEAVERIEALESENRKSRGELEGVIGRFGGLEKENQCLRGDVSVVLKRLGGLQTENAALKADVRQVLQKFSSLEKENFTLRGDISEVAQNLSTLETENAALKKNVNDHVQAFEDMQAVNVELTARVFELEKLAEQQEQERMSSGLPRIKTPVRDKEKGSKPGTLIQALRNQGAAPSTSTITQTRNMSQKRGQSELSLDADEDTIIPDSIPTPPSRPSRHRDISFPTRTREGTKTQTSAADDQKNKYQNQVLEKIHQGGRSLGSYLKRVDRLRRENPMIPEEAFVMAFKNGLQDESDQRRVTELTGRVGLVWDRVKRLVEDMEWDETSSRGDVQGDRDKKPRVVMDAPGKRGAAGEDLRKRREKKGRRSIPIVEDDDDDELFVT